MNKDFILTLLNIPKVSRKIINSMLNIGIEKNLNENALLDMFISCKSQNKRIVIPTIEEIKKAKEKASMLINQCEKEEIGIMTILDDNFSSKLKTINDNPVILFYKGNKDCISMNKSVAIIGTRNPTEHGAKVAERLGYIFGEDNFMVISGLANGCDEFAHIGCIKSNGKSIAVLPCGLDNIYPASNRSLASQILEKDGCLVSEYQIGQKPFKNLFVERDRLQSALSSGVIVVETAKVGGTMHTVKFALEQGKVLACYKHNNNFKNESKVQGNTILLEKEGILGIDSTESICIFKDKIISNFINDNKIVKKTQVKFDI